MPPSSVNLQDGSAATKWDSCPRFWRSLRFRSSVFAQAGQQQASDVPFVPTPQSVVEAMLKLAALGADDVLVDLGSGDGRIVITAAKQFGARAIGVELDPALVRASRANADREHVSARNRVHRRRSLPTRSAPRVRRHALSDAKRKYPFETEASQGNVPGIADRLTSLRYGTLAA